jgi:hypothetical protein
MGKRLKIAIAVLALALNVLPRVTPMPFRNWGMG